MATFHQTVWEGHPDLDFLFPLQDEEGNTYQDFKSARASFIAGKRLFHVHELSSGVVILERYHTDDEWLLVSSHEEAVQDLLVAAEELNYRECVLQSGFKLLCNSGPVHVFGGYGKTLHGKTWAYLEVNTHQVPPGDLLSALLLKGVIQNEMAEEWSTAPPDDCDGDHTSYD